MQTIPNRTWFIKTAQLLDAYEGLLTRTRGECEAMGLSVEEQDLRIAELVRERDRLREDFLRMEREILEWRKSHET